MRVLLAYESGYGLGHLTRLADIARKLRTRGTESVLASFRLDDADTFADAFDTVVQGPVWPAYFAQERVIQVTSGSSFAIALSNMGFGVPRYVAANQRAWGAIIDQWKINALVGDYAPGAILAAFGRCPSIQVGGPVTTPAMAGDRFPPFLPEQEVDGQLERKFMESIVEALERIGRPPPSNLAEAVIGRKSLPTGFKEFDPYSSCRREPLLRPDMVPMAPGRRGNGDYVFAYFPQWMQHNDLLMASLCALRLPVRLFMPHVAGNLETDLKNNRVEIVNRPFSVDELAQSARVFVHHGGLGSCHFGLIAGIPQLVLESDMEKTVNGRALATLGVGRSLNYHRITLPRLRDEVTALYEDHKTRSTAGDVAAMMRQRLTGPDPLDIVVEEIVNALQ